MQRIAGDLRQQARVPEHGISIVRIALVRRQVLFEQFRIRKSRHRP
jgi:hypothetical protein